MIMVHFSVLILVESYMLTSYVHKLTHISFIVNKPMMMIMTISGHGTVDQQL